MALKIKKSCATCQMIKRDRKLLKRIQASAQYVRGGEPLMEIAKDYGLRYAGLHNHCKKHQGISEEDRANRELDRLQKEIQNEQVRKVVKHNDVRQIIMDEGARQIEEGKLKLTAGAIVSAAKHASDIEEKHLDRQLEILKMVNAFASGEIVNVGELDAGAAQPAPDSYIEG